MNEARVTLSPGMEVTKAVRLVRPLGEGGMGAVWLGEHTGLKTTVVVKFMVEALDESQSARTRFSREAAAAAQVKSPHVVQMLDHGVTDTGLPFIVMEHLQGRDLSALLAERGKLEPREVVVIVSQVAKALAKDGGNWQLWFDLARASDGRTRANALDLALKLDPHEPALADFRTLLGSISTLQGYKP